MVLLAPFYNPVLLAEQIGTLAAFAEAPLTLALALGQGERQFAAFGIEESSRVRRLEELLMALRALLHGKPATVNGQFYSLSHVHAGPTPRVPISLWIAGTVRAAAARAGWLGDGWLTGQNATRADLVEQLDTYLESATNHGRPPLPVLRRDLFVGTSDAEAEGVVKKILSCFPVFTSCPR
jgi:alkanesulfonate monooxygenase SsuD/methylene tetrahydromethanopterin reductase-like flavin-dependent oxidoreductase (luciferase family)